MPKFKKDSKGFKMSGWSGWVKSPLKKEPGSYTETDIKAGPHESRIMMDKWADPSPKTWDQGSESFVTPESDENPMYKDRFLESEKARVHDKGPRGLKSLETAGGDPLVGRTITKGETRTGDDSIEKYVEGDKMVKTTKRKKKSLKMKRDKVKQKKKGYVRKTGEGFLGLQNRKKYIDGVEQQTWQDKYLCLKKRNKLKEKEFMQNQRLLGVQVATIIKNHITHKENETTIIIIYIYYNDW